jgi:transcription initiation factor IIE alpha subunit
MTSIENDDDNIHNRIITEILTICTHGSTEQKIMEHTQLSHDQLRRIMAEIVDRQLLHYMKHVTSILQQIKDTYFLKGQGNLDNIIEAFSTNWLCRSL